VIKSYALALAGAVLVTAAGAAHAQTVTTREERAAVRAETPWYERFTYGQGPTEVMTGLGPSDRTSQPAWSLSQRWGVTLDVRQAERLDPTTRRQAADEAAVGAYFQFTPRVRVGGQVSLRDADTIASPVPAQPDGEEAAAGVRLESAFRF
jgi:hypothetical protein